MRIFSIFFCFFTTVLCAQTNGNNMNMTGAIENCNRLSTEEQSFASQLSPMHQVLFCGKFSPAQRSQAMSLFQKSQQPPPVQQGLWESSRDEQGITQDEAVEEVLKQSRTKSPKPKKQN